MGAEFEEFNRAIEALEPSKSVTLMAKAKRMQKEDPAVINLTGGEPDFPTPKRICDEAIRWMKAGYTHYTDGPGNEDLRVRIAQKLQEENHAPYQADQIIVTPGGKFGVYLTIRTLLNPKDEAIWLTPGWVSYPSIVEASGGVPVAVHLKYEENYRITEEALEEAVSDRTKLLILNYPNNPTGKILTESDVRALSAFLMRHPKIRVLSDEMYEKVIYDGQQSFSLASIPELFDRVITLNGFSKASAMTGWRIGYLACDRRLRARMMKLFGHTISCTSGFIQKGALVALDCKEETEQMRQEYEARRNLLARGFEKIPGLDWQIPEGAFYAWVRFHVSEDSETFCSRLLDEAKIAGVPGDSYGEENGTFVRFSFASSREVLQRFLAQLKDFMDGIR